MESKLSLDSGVHAVDSVFYIDSLSVELGFWIPNVSGILDSLRCIRIPKNFPDSGIGIPLPRAKPLIFLGYNPPYGKRWRPYILPQFLSNLTRPITHKVIYIFFWGGGGSKFIPVIATLPILGLKFIKLFCAFL